MDRARGIGLNAIIFHVRLSGDALYQTPLAPWSAKLTGRQGVNPGYDPLAVVVREAHARGLQVHAWFNPFRASLDGGIRAARNHVTRVHHEWVRRYGRQQWIDPGIPAVYRVAALADGRPFLAMKLIKGQTLADLLGSGAALNPLAVYAEDFRLVAMDQRNAGRSRGPLDLSDPWGSYVDDQLALMDVDDERVEDARALVEVPVQRTRGTACRSGVDRARGADPGGRRSRRIRAKRRSSRMRI